MSLRDVKKEYVKRAIEEFDEIHVDGMLRKYSGGKSTRWYIECGGERYDQKLVLRAAHEWQGLGPLPSGRGTFNADQARRHLTSLGCRVVDGRAT